MPITLNSTLAAALSSTSHHPICKIITEDQLAEIPFDGNFFDTYSYEQDSAGLILADDGSLVEIYRMDTDGSNDLFMSYTDTERQTWNSVQIFDSLYNIIDADIIQLNDGNFGVAILQDRGSSRRIYTQIIDNTGTVLSGPTQLGSDYSESTQLVDTIGLGPLSDGTFIMAFSLEAVAATSTHYFMYSTGSSIFGGWSSPATMDSFGLETYDRKRSNPNFLAATSGYLWVYFDYVDSKVEDTERWNIFSAWTDDDGATWSNANTVTSFVGFSEIAKSPYAVEKIDDDVRIVFHKEITVLRLDENTNNYCESAGVSAGSGVLHITHLHFDPSSRLLFCVNAYQSSGPKPLNSILVIDVDTWTIVRCYKQDAPPGWNDFWNDMVSIMWTNVGGQGRYVVIPSNHSSCKGFLILNDQAETVTELFLDDNSTYLITKNFDTSSFPQMPYGLGYLCEYMSVRVDASAGKFYVYGSAEYYLNWDFMVFSMDLTPTPDGDGLYKPEMIFIDSGSNYQSICTSWSGDGQAFDIDPNNDKMVVGGNFDGYYHANYAGFLQLRSLSTGSLIQHFEWHDGEGFHWIGLNNTIYYNGKIYGNVSAYTTNKNCDEHRGLCIIDTATRAITYSRPTFSTRDDYYLMDLEVYTDPNDGHNKIVMGSSDGLAIYDLNTGLWSLLNNDTHPGWFYENPDNQVCGMVAVDTVGEMFFTGHRVNVPPNDAFLFAVPMAGSIYQAYYIDGALQGDSRYAYAGTAKLTQNYGTYNPTVVYDPTNVMWSTWTYYRTDIEEISHQWDNAGFSPDLADYLLADTPVILNWEIERVNYMEFQIARGDLFDPTNHASTYSAVLKKGRLVEVHLGEKVSGTNYWQPQGKFIITEVSVSYSKTSHPTVTVRAEDKGAMWPEMVLTATSPYEAEDPDDIYIDLLEDFGNYTSEEYSIPTTISTYHPVYIQWVDETLQDIIDELNTHFGLFGYWRQDGKWTLKRLNMDRAVDHDYGESNIKIMHFSPDDSNSSYINKVTVRCESRETIEVLWDEERITQVSGSLGWWSKNETITVYFSDDKTRQCRNSRLEVLQSLEDWSPLLGFIDDIFGRRPDQYISYVDPSETFIYVKLEGPNRAMYVFAFAAIVLGFGLAAIGCDIGVYGPHWCHIFILATNIALSFLIEALAAVASYRYDIYARPIGHEKEMLQASANDYAFQDELGGLVVTEEFDDPLSYQVEHCQMVANNELQVVKNQRRRVKFEKTAHLQDEIGDILQINHPISNIPIRTFVTRITREFIRPNFDGQGSFKDKIEGWRISD
jgi:hypothetical protein